MLNASFAISRCKTLTINVDQIRLGVIKHQNPKMTEHDCLVVMKQVAVVFKNRVCGSPALHSLSNHV